MHEKYDALVKSFLSSTMFDGISTQNLAIAQFLLQHLEHSQLISTQAGEKCINAMLSVFEHNSFRSTIRLIELFIEKEVQSNS